MITDDSLGIGLVTYKNSKYLNSKGEHELFNYLVDRLGVLGQNVKIANLDKYDLESLDIGVINFIIGNSILLKTILISRINVMIKSKNFKIFKGLKNTIGDVIDVMMSVIIYLLSKITRRRNQKYLSFAVRQANISNNHISILSELGKQNIEWIIVVEDDIRINDEVDLKKVINELTNRVKENIDIRIVNLSKSFSDYDLGIENIKIKKIYINDERTKHINLYAYPISNTVCATLYRADIINNIVKELKCMEKYVFIPIDHKLNIAMHKMLTTGEAKRTVYASIDPGIFVQGSLHG